MHKMPRNLSEKHIENFPATTIMAKTDGSMMLKQEFLILNALQKNVQANFLCVTSV